MFRTLSATLVATALVLPILHDEVQAGVCKSRQGSFNQLAAQDAAILARMRAAGAANNCPALIAAGNQRIALLQRAASIRSSVVNCEDATHKNSDRDAAGFDSREIALTRNAMAACSAAVASNPKPAQSNRAPARSAAASRDSDCSDVSGTGGPRIACREKRPAAMVDSSKTTVKQAERASKPSSSFGHSGKTGTATKIAAELLSQSAPSGTPKVDTRTVEDHNDSSENKPSAVAAVQKGNAVLGGPGNKWKSEEAPKGNGPCGAIITKEYLNIGNNLQQEFAECLVVANKCTAKINFRASSSTVRNTKLSGDVDPGKVGKICATKERETITYLGWKFENERWPK